MDWNQKQTYCLGERDYSQTVNQKVYGKVNVKTQKIIKNIKGISSSCNL